MRMRLWLAGEYNAPNTNAVAERLDELGILYRKIGPDGDNPGGVTLGTPVGRFQDDRIFALFGKPKSLEKKAART